LFLMVQLNSFFLTVRNLDTILALELLLITMFSLPYNIVRKLRKLSLAKEHTKYHYGVHFKYY